MKIVQCNLRMYKYIIKKIIIKSKVSVYVGEPITVAEQLDPMNLRRV